MGYEHVINLLKLYARIEENHPKIEAIVLNNIFPG
jgi:hypothetical protein